MGKSKVRSITLLNEIETYVCICSFVYIQLRNEENDSGGLEEINGNRRLV